MWNLSFHLAADDLQRFLENMKYLLLIFILSTASTIVAEEVSTSVGGKNLEGDLTSAGENKSLIVFIISGSGPTDKDGNTTGASGKNNSLLYLSNLLNKEGISTLRVDKRGVGASSSAAVSEADLRFSTYVEDVGHWIKFLEKQGYSKIVLMGHSEGALVATLAASSKSVISLISIAGAGRAAGTVLKEQLKPKLPNALYSEAEKIISSLENGQTAKDYPPALEALFRPSAQPYLISWFKVDPAKAITAVQVPILIVQGSTDLQTSIEDANLLHSKAKGSELLVIQGMNHVLKDISGDLKSQLPSYFQPDLPLHKDLGIGVLKFINKTTSNKDEIVAPDKLHQ
jgi:uncharacterized protein